MLFYPRSKCSNFFYLGQRRQGKMHSLVFVEAVVPVGDRVEAIMRIVIMMHVRKTR